jgi:hypothetical protein
MFVAVAAALAPAAVMAVDLPPGGSTPLAGVHGGAGPGSVIPDTWLPFQVHGGGGALLYEGELRDRVVRLDATGTLAFVRQVRGTNGSLNGAVGELACSEYASFLTDVDFSTSSTGTITPDTAWRSTTGSVVAFQFNRTPVYGGQESRMVHAKTEAVEYANGGECTIKLTTGEYATVEVVRPVRYSEPGCRPIDFEDLPMGTQFPAGGSFVSSGVLMHLEEFYWDVGSCTNPTMNGFVAIDNNGMACGSGNDLVVNNVNVAFDYGVLLTDLVIHFGEYGGNVNLTVNGQCVSENFLSNVPPVIGGVAVTVVEPNPGNGCGRLSLHGSIYEVSIGGQEFWIDDIECTPDVCFDDETPPVAELHAPPPATCVCDPVTIIGTADDANFDHYVLEYRRVAEATWHLIQLGTAPIVSDLLGVWNAAGLTQGHYLIRLTVRDACGHSETAVNMVWLGTTFDNLTVREPDNGDILGGRVCVDGTAWDNYCFDEYYVEYQPAGGSGWNAVDPLHPVYTTTVINDPIAYWETIDLSLSDGDYLVRAWARDDCGNTDTEIREVVVDNTWPDAEITNPEACEYVEGAVNVIGTAFDANLASWTLQYTGGDAPGWVTINTGTTSVVNDLLGVWNTTSLRPCAYTLRLLVTDQAVINCNNAIHHWSEYTVSVNVGACGDFDVDDDGDVDLYDYSWFERDFTGPHP